MRVFEDLTENAQAFMADVARSIELQQAEPTAVATYKRRLIDYLERFMGDLVRRSDAIARRILAIAPRIDELLRHVAEREARDAAPGDAQDQTDAQTAVSGMARTLEGAARLVPQHRPRAAASRFVARPSPFGHSADCSGRSPH